MLFRRRSEPNFSQRLRLAVWPRRNWARSSRYVTLRLMRLKASPHQIALGGAAGVFAAFTPFLGAQMALAAALAAVCRASVPAALLGTFVGNPLSWPAIWAGTYAAGSLIMGGSGTLKAAELEHHINVLGEAVRDGSPEHIDAAAGLLMPLLAPMTAGCLPLGVLMAAIFYYTLRPAVAASQARRRA